MKIYNLNKPTKEGWKGITTIDDVWDDLMYRFVITIEERERVRKLTHTEQQNELDKYKQFRRKHY